MFPTYNIEKHRKADMYRKKKEFGFACFFTALGMLIMLFMDSKLWGMLLSGLLLIVGNVCIGCER